MCTETKSEKSLNVTVIQSDLNRDSLLLYLNPEPFSSCCVPEKSDYNYLQTVVQFIEQEDYQPFRYDDEFLVQEYVKMSSESLNEDLSHGVDVKEDGEKLVGLANLWMNQCCQLPVKCSCFEHQY